MTRTYSVVRRTIGLRVLGIKALAVSIEFDDLDMRAALKARGYRWDPAGKAWELRPPGARHSRDELDSQQVADEIAWLRTQGALLRVVAEPLTSTIDLWRDLGLDGAPAIIDRGAAEHPALQPQPWCTDIGDPPDGWHDSYATATLRFDEQAAP